MNTVESNETLDALFASAVGAIDAGDVAALERVIAEHPRLLRERLDTPGAWLRDKVGSALDGFFQRPYLLWFIAEDPVRSGTLPKNSAQIAQTIIDGASREGVDSLREQLDYALTLVSWSWIARDAGVQIELIDTLIDAGASPGESPDNALVNGNLAAAAHLVERGAPLTLGSALCLGRWDDVARLAPAASQSDRQFALVLAALNGNADALRRVIDIGGDVNLPSERLYSHGTPLHHAVASGSLDAVRLLVEAGASVNTRDTAWNGTPLGWAEHYQQDHQRAARGSQFAQIAAFLEDRMSNE